MSEHIMNTHTFSVIIADSHEIVRDGISAIIEAQCPVTVAGHAADGYSTLKQCRTLEPDILLMDLGLLSPSGMDVFQKLRKTQPDIKIIVMFSELSPVDAYVLLSNGAAGFVPKQSPGAHFAHATNTVSMGYACVSAELLQGFVTLRHNVSRTGNIYGLSRREAEILEHCTKGVSTKEIASRLKISARTVETHRNAIYRKTETNSIQALPDIARKIQMASTL